MRRLFRSVFGLLLLASSSHSAQAPWELLLVEAERCPDSMSAGIQFDERHVFLSDWDSGQQAYVSTTSGQSWSIYKVKRKDPTNPLGPKIAYLNQGSGIIQSDQGDYFFEDTGGEWRKWERQIQSVCLRGKYGYIMENKPLGNVEPALYHTESGGMEWTRLSSPELWFDGISSFDRVNDALIFALVYVFDKNSRLITHLARTTDNGAHWTDVADITHKLDFWPTHLFFLDDNTGWISSDRDEGLFTTTDGGISWKGTTTPTGIVSGIFFRNMKSGRVLGGQSSQMYETEDGGNTWRSMQQDEVERESFVSFFGFSGIDRWNDLAVHRSAIRCKVK